jgi:hypothetical protein
MARGLSIKLIDVFVKNMLKGIYYVKKINPFTGNRFDAAFFFAGRAGAEPQL